MDRSSSLYSYHSENKTGGPYRLPLYPGTNIPLTKFEMILVRVDNFRKALLEEKTPETFLACVGYVAKTSGIPFETLKDKLRI